MHFYLWKLIGKKCHRKNQNLKQLGVYVFDLNRFPKNEIATDNIVFFKTREFSRQTQF